MIRSRDPQVLATGDIVLDVGGKNDGVKNFDHHQEVGRSGTMASRTLLGLIWKRFGKRLRK